ncbi:MAG: hypothetical protein OEZ36_04050 [Spirochaetota bacterium]|nr:hypothetical protein [Spirochaetota bacterium]
MLKDLLLGSHRKILGINQRNLRYIYPNNARKHFSLVDEKIRTKEIFSQTGVPYPATRHVFSSYRELMDFEAIIAKHPNSVIKPNKGRGGNGVIILGDRVSEGFRDAHGRIISFRKLKRQVADILLGVYSHGMSDLALVEERIFPHEFLYNLYEKGLSDIRIILYQNEPVMGMIRIPTKLSHGKANLHQGGVGVGLNLESGVTTHASFRGKSITSHPDSGEPLVRIQLPHIKELIGICRKVSTELPMKYLGFDLTLDKKTGPMIIEVNARPGLEIQNVNQAGLLELL